jgi:hypothetical protein
MASTKVKYTIRHAKNLEEAKALWWPLMQELGWVRTISFSVVLLLSNLF